MVKPVLARPPAITITLTQVTGFTSARIVRISAVMSPRLIVGIPLVLSLAACGLPELSAATSVQAGFVGSPGSGLESSKKPGKKPSEKPSNKLYKKPHHKPGKQPPPSEPNEKPNDKPTIKPPPSQPSEKPPEPSEPPPSNPSEPPPSDPSEPPPSDPPAAPPSGEETGPLIGLLAAHNEARTAVGVAPLTWSNEVATHAQDWANQLAANGCQLAHRSKNIYGENLYWSSNSRSAAQVVAAWVVESADYDADTNTCASGKICGHYTQVVWSNTTRLGCGRATCGTSELWVCNYDPRGNWNGQAPF